LGRTIVAPRTVDVEAINRRAPINAQAVTPFRVRNAALVGIEASAVILRASKAQTGIGLQLAQPRADHCKAQSTGALPAKIGEIQAVVSSDVNTGSRQAANVGVQVNDVTSAHPKLAVRVPLDISARCSQTSRIAGIQRVLRANAGDQVV